MNSFIDAWKSVCQVLLEKMHQVAFDTWIADLAPVELSGNVAIIRSRTEYQKNIVEKNYSDKILDSLEEVFGAPIKLRIVVADSDLDRRITKKAIENSIPFYKKYTFENFIVGPTNKFAHAAALAVANNPGKSYNPLFIYGNSGLGKTHLLNAIRNCIEESYPDKDIVYCQGEKFATEIITAMMANSTQDFRDKYRKADVLIIDDIQIISSMKQVQVEFFNTFNTLFEESKQIIISSDRPPKEINELDDRLNSRFESGLLADIQLPTYEMRIAIITRKAQSNGIEIPESIITHIANHLKSNIRQLEGIVNKITAYKSLTDEIPSLADVTTMIGEIKKDDMPNPVSPETIISEVAAAFNVKPEDISSKKQNAEVATARHFVAYILREITNMSLESIGELVGRTHSTVHTSLKVAEKEIKNNPRIRAKIEELIKSITS